MPCTTDEHVSPVNLRLGFGLVSCLTVDTLVTNSDKIKGEYSITHASADYLQDQDAASHNLAPDVFSSDPSPKTRGR